MNGGTLLGLIRREGPLTGDDALRVVTAMCGALAEAHALGIVHRDIKPKNILFGTAGPNRVPKLADFGIAGALPDAGAEEGERRALVMYSRRWASPEQMTSAPIGPRSDIYSLALVTAYMLTGKTAFSATGPEDGYRERTRSDALIDGTFDGVDVPPAVVRLLKHACSFDPERRPGDANALAAALSEGFTSHHVVTSAPRHEDTPLRPVAGGAARPAAAAPARTARRLTGSDAPVAVGGRTAHFVPAPAGVADVTYAPTSTRVRVSLIPGAAGRLCVHVQGLSCFVALAGGRPSRAVQLAEDGALDLVAPNHRRLGHIRVSFGRPAAGHTVFTVDEEEVAIAHKSHPQPVALDLGAGAEVLFLYTPRAGGTRVAGRTARDP
jgi:serine/threonine-protein kinase